MVCSFQAFVGAGNRARMPFSNTTGWYLAAALSTFLPCVHIVAMCINVYKDCIPLYLGLIYPQLSLRDRPYA